MEQQQFGEPREEGLFEESINLRHYWHIILERRWLVAATFAVVMVLCLFYLFTATSIFSATTRLQIDNETENSMRMESFVMEGMQGQDYLQTQYKNLQSRSLMALALAGAQVYHAGLVGPEGSWLVDKLQNIGVDMQFTGTSGTPTGHALIQVDPQGKNSIVIYPGCNFELSRESIEVALKHFIEGDILLLQNEINEIPYWMGSDRIMNVMKKGKLLE